MNITGVGSDDLSGLELLHHLFEISDDALPHKWRLGALGEGVDHRILAAEQGAIGFAFTPVALKDLQTTAIGIAEENDLFRRYSQDALSCQRFLSACFPQTQRLGLIEGDLFAVQCE